MAAKFESDDPLEAAKREILDLVQAYESGISEAELSRTMSSTSMQIRMNAINALTDAGKIQLCKRGSDLIYRPIDARTSLNHSAIFKSGISLEEKAVYQVVESAGSKGIWNRELRNQTKLPLNQMSKVLKSLETKKLIKAVKSVTASKKKLYMLYGIEPDKSVTGGAWYSGTEFESEYVQILHEQCYQFIKRRLHAAEEKGDFVSARDASLVSSTEVKDYIDDLKISTVKLTLQDIEMVLETIMFDGLIEKISVERPRIEAEIPIKRERGAVSSSDEEEPETSNTVHYYRALPKLVSSTGVMRSPCGYCPYIHECKPESVINSNDCKYIEKWFMS